MSTPTAILFPGQGSQTPEMRDLVARVRPELLELAADAVGEDPFARADEGTNFAQPAIFCASLAGWEALGGWAGTGSPELMAGHSLGELGALVAAGALDEREGLRLVALRGRLMHESGLAAGDGSMLALMGAGASEQAAEIAAAHDLTVANDNSPMQVVLSGAAVALPAAADHARGLGLRPMELDVAGAFHSPMMAGGRSRVPGRPGANDVLRAALPGHLGGDRPALHRPVAELADALTMPVRWREVMLTLHELGAQRFVDVGPGRVLTGLAKRTLAGVELVNA